MQLRTLDGFRCLLVDPEPERGAAVETALRRCGATSIRAADAAEAFARLEEGLPDAVLVALALRDVPGTEIVRWASARGSGAAAIVFAERATACDAALALEAGARQLVVSDRDLPDRLLEAVLELAGGRRAAGCAAESFVGTSAAAAKVRRRIAECSGCEAAVLVCGETGAGKEIVARAIHSASARSRGPLVAVNCAAIPEALVEGELFGAARGAYTGADRDREGLLAAAGGGTVFLDEVGELPLSAQAKLLRFLDGGRVRPLGAACERCVDARVIAATHRDLERMVGEGRFREDLWFRLDVLRVEVPPLRTRRADVPVLARHLADRLAGPGRVVFAPEALRALLAHPWRGNVRELEGALQRALAVGGGFVRAVDLELAPDPPEDLADLLARYRGDVASLARALRVTPRTVQRRLARRGLRAADYRRNLAAQDPWRGAPV